MERRPQLAAVGQVRHDGKEREEGSAEGHLPWLNIAAGQLDEGLHCEEDNDRGDF
jgi:hypothetical protein